MRRTNRRWTRAEEEILLSHVKQNPQNLHNCFIAVGRTTGRSAKAVASHWYTRTSKDPDNLCFFTASSRHVSKNRKNGEGVVSTNSIWQRFLRVLRSL